MSVSCNCHGMVPGALRKLCRHSTFLVDVIPLPSDMFVRESCESIDGDAILGSASTCESWPPRLLFKEDTALCEGAVTAMCATMGKVEQW